MNDIATKLRHHAVTLRTNSMPLADLIPLLQQAADALDQSAALARQAALQSMIEEAEKLGLYDEAAPQAEQQDERDLAINAETCAVCGEGKALLVRSCSCCGSLYAGSAEMRENRKQAGQAPAPGADDARDAARYRWLRDNGGDWAICSWGQDGDHGEYYREGRAADVVDRAIDSAMGKAKPPVQGGQS